MGRRALAPKPMITPNQALPVEEASFTLFMKLPIEIRLTIWRIARPERCLKLINLLHNPNTQYHHPPLHRFHVSENSIRRLILTDVILKQTPLILNAVNQEARYETQRTYAWLGNTKTLSTPLVLSGDVDTIYITDSGSCSECIQSWCSLIAAFREAGQKVQKLLIDLDLVRLEVTLLKEQVDIFLTLDELVLVLGKGRTQREKIITADNIRIGSTSWGPGVYSQKQGMTTHIEELLKGMKVMADNDHEGRMPVVKVMVMAR